MHRFLTNPVTSRVVLGIGLGATALASFAAWRQVRSRDEARFIALTDVVRNSIIHELDHSADALSGARALWSIHHAVSREDWRLYVENLNLSAGRPGLRGLGFIEYVPSPGPPTSAARIDSQTTARERFVVKLVEPEEPNRPALGYDVATEPSRRVAAETARDTGKATLTQKLELVQAPGVSGALFLLPVYAPGMQVTNVSQRRANLVGWVYAVLVPEGLLKHARLLVQDAVTLQIYDGPDVSPGTQFLLEPQAPKVTAANFERITQLQFGNHVWTLRFQPGPGFTRTPWFSAPGYLCAGGLGLCISLLAFSIARALTSMNERARALADEMTAKLRLQHHAISCARNGLFILDAGREDCPIIYANPAFERITGYSVTEPLGKETMLLLKKNSPKTELPGMRSLLQEGAANHTVIREYRRSGEESWAEFRLVPVLDEGGRKTHYLGIVEDVSERKRAERQLAQVEQRYHGLVENLPVGIYRNTPGQQGNFLEVNPALVAMVEADSREDLFKHAVSDLYVDPVQRKEISDRLLSRGWVKELQVELRTLKGRRFWASITASAQRDEGGHTVFDGVAVDITERKHAEQALRESQERFTLAVRGANDGIWDWNVVTGEVYFSPRWKAMLGYEENEVPNTFDGWKQLVHPEDLERALETIRTHFAGQSDTYELEHRLRHKNGTYRWILARGVALRDKDGKALRMAGSHVDLTARKEAEEQLRIACRELALSQERLQDTVRQLKASHTELQKTQLQLIQAAKMECVGTLAAGVAHEVKNPLQTILIGLRYLENSLPQDAREVQLAVSDMRDAVLRANTIIRDLLQLSAHTEFELSPGNFNAVVERSLRLLNSDLVNAHIEVHRRLDSNLPPIRMDAGRMEQVMLNLLINALQAMAHDGALHVSTRSGKLGSALQVNGAIASRFSPGESLVLVELQDTGPGIPPAHLPRIFDPFFTTKPVGQGTGLGLPIARKIVDLHQGAMEIQNAPEGGVRVTLAFRAEEREHDEETNHDSR